MNTITIPKNLIKNDDLVIISRKNYEKLLRSKKIIPTAKLNFAEKKSLEKARKEMAQGEYLTLEELEYAMESTHRQKRC